MACIFTTCKNYNEEDLYPAPPACDTSNVTYSRTIIPILKNNCYECHSTMIASGGIILDTWEGVSLPAGNGWLVAVINHRPGFPQMPKGRDKLPDCDINQITRWVNIGYPDN